jgi:hypothetical protein
MPTALLNPVPIWQTAVTLQNTHTPYGPHALYSTLNDRIPPAKQLTLPSHHQFKHSDQYRWANRASLPSVRVLTLTTARSRVCPEKLTVPQLLKKLPTLHGIQKSITTFTTASHLFLSSAGSIHPFLQISCHLIAENEVFMFLLLTFVFKNHAMLTYLTQWKLRGRVEWKLTSAKNVETLLCAAVGTAKY